LIQWCVEKSCEIEVGKMLDIFDHRWRHSRVAVITGALELCGLSEERFIVLVHNVLYDLAAQLPRNEYMNRAKDESDTIRS
jgi:hypothetical protein